MSAIGWISVAKIAMCLPVLVLGVNFAAWWLVVPFALLAAMECCIVVGESNPWWR